LTAAAAAAAAAGIAVGNGAIGKGFMNPTVSDFSYPLELQIYLPLYYQ